MPLHVAGFAAQMANVERGNKMEPQPQNIEEIALTSMETTSLSTVDATAIEQELTAQGQKVFALCRQVQHLTRVKRIWLLVGVPPMLVCYAIFGLLVPLSELFAISIGPLEWAYITWALIPSLPLMLIPGFRLLYYYPLAMGALDSLKQLEDVRSVGLFVEGLANEDVRLGAIEALTRLLPRLRASDAALLTERQHKLLCQALKRSGGGRFTFQPDARKTNRMFAFAVLKAFEQVGTSQAVPVVAYLAEKSPSSEVRRAALECLPYLNARAQKEQNEKTLLRASASSEVASEELLRPASGQNEVNPQQLLRASSGSME
jgi:hypothetical protein